VTGLGLGSLIAPYRSALRGRQVLRELVVREVQSTFHGSVLGTGWFVLQPLAMLVVYAAVFGGILRLGRPGGGMEFIVTLFSGMVVFGAFSEPVGRASRLVLARPNYVTKVVFPLDLLPWPVVATAALHGATSVVLLLLLQLVATHTLPWTAVLVPLLLVPVLAIGLGISWFLAALGVYVRDTNEVVRVVVQLAFFVCPVVWTAADVAHDSALHWLVVLNPLAVAMEAMRAALTGAAWPSWPALFGLGAAALLLPAVGHAFFRRTQDGFADVL
jgi:lipopolysaccharide transport system permease protein